MSPAIRLIGAVAAALLLTMPVVSGAQPTDSPLTIHGYLSQGFGVTDGLPLYGLTRNATTDYRAIALVVRYALDPRHNFVVQFRNRRFGNSVLTRAEGEVAVNWAYYHGLFGPLAIKIGKVPIPFGIFNETRAVGTLLPFYRAPSFIYSDGQETETGALLTYRSPELSGWSAEVNAHYGDEDFPQLVVTPAGPLLNRPIQHHRVGGYVWLNTPISGVRVGGGGVTLNVIDTTNMFSYRVNDLRYAADATGDHVFVHSEAKYYRLGMYGKTRAYYIESGARVIGDLSVNGLYQQTNSFGTRSAPPPGTTPIWSKSSDRAVSLKYAFNPSLVSKLELHHNLGYNYDTFISTAGPPGKANYVLASLAMSF
ncbi:MAG: hypothetical protein JWL95_303 [Gemmatimonadetes bacterium]|nr:hypothetical protein [Gemmatimonadota bacterium]